MQPNRPSIAFFDQDKLDEVHCLFLKGDESKDDQIAKVSFLKLDSAILSPISVLDIFSSSFCCTLAVSSIYGRKMTASARAALALVLRRKAHEHDEAFLPSSIQIEQTYKSCCLLLPPHCTLYFVVLVYLRSIRVVYASLVAVGCRETIPPRLAYMQ